MHAGQRPPHARALDVHLLKWSLTLRSDTIHALRVVLKESLKGVPFFGWVLQALCFIFLSRDRNQDVPHIAEMTAHLVSANPAPPTYLIFPEGTDLSESQSNFEKANKWGAEHGLERCEQVLHPRATGLLHPQGEAAPLRRHDGVPGLQGRQAHVGGGVRTCSAASRVKCTVIHIVVAG